MSFHFFKIYKSEHENAEYELKCIENGIYSASPTEYLLYSDFYGDELSNKRLNICNILEIALPPNMNYAWIEQLKHKQQNQIGTNHLNIKDIIESQFLMTEYTALASLLCQKLCQLWELDRLYVLPAVAAFDFIVIAENMDIQDKADQVFEKLHAIIGSPSEQFMEKINQESIAHQKLCQKASIKQYWTVSFNPRSYLFQHIYNEIETSKLNSIEKEEAYSYLQLILKKKELQLANIRWLNDVGEFYPDAPGTKSYFDHVEDTLFKYLYAFLDNTKNNHLTPWSWMYYFYFRIVRDDLLSDIHSIERKDVWKTVNFLGIYPVITQTVEGYAKWIHSVNGFYSSPFYNIDFLSIPSECAVDFWKYFPSYLHEFYHYIPSDYRNVRNKIVMELSALELFSPIYKTLQTTVSDANAFELIMSIVELFFQYDAIPKEIMQNFDNLVQFDENDTIDETREKVYDLKHNKRYYDSLYIYATMEKTHHCIDFDHMFHWLIDEIEQSNLKNKDSILYALKISKNNCENIWETQFLSKFRIYCRLFKELRSDMAMCTILNWNVDDYMNYILQDDIMCLRSATETAPSTILRISIAMRWLYEPSQSKTKSRSLIQYCKEKLNNQRENEKAINLINYLNKFETEMIALGQLIEEMYSNDLINKWIYEYENDKKHSDLLKNAAELYSLRNNKNGNESLSMAVENCLFFQNYYFFKEY